MEVRQSGVALVQVLLVTAIVMLVVTQIALLARHQTQRAQALQDRAEAALYLQSREAALIYTMLTEPLSADADSENLYAAAWNFHGEPFRVDGLEFSLQDQSGLLRLPLTNTQRFFELLQALDVDPGRAKTITDRVGAWIGISGRGARQVPDAMMRGGVGGPVQYFDELRLIPGIDEQLYSRLSRLMTLYPTPGFNPLTAPSEILGMWMPESTVRAVLAARDAGTLDQDRLWDLARMGADDEIVPLTGPGIGIRLAGTYRDVSLQRRLIVGILPYNAEPLQVWARERFASGVPR
jgi:general secretion pathway protein K